MRSASPSSTHRRRSRLHTCPRTLRKPGHRIPNRGSAHCRNSTHCGYLSLMEAVTTIDTVRTFETRGGNARYVVRDVEGHEYTTFREAIGDRASELEGRRVRIEYHEEQRGRYTNVYLDKVEAAPEQPAARDHAHTDTDPEEVAWRTAVEAAPWLVGDSDPHAKTGPEELYETLKPFKDKVAEDIKRSNADDE